MICPDCETELEYHDDSFDHEFGVEIIKYFWCPKCDKEVEVHGDDEE